MNGKTDIEITISGAMAAGKTVAAGVVGAALEAQGYKVSYFDGCGGVLTKIERPSVDGITFEERSVRVLTCEEYGLARGLPEAAPRERKLYSDQ